MRLLNTSSLRVEEFSPSHVPEYAILSHTWRAGEVSLQDMKHRHLKRFSKKDGFRKISRSAKEARAAGFSYIWIDTCCIDKASSAELSESINSMYRWYEEAAVCLVHLDDIHVQNTSLIDEPDISKSRWLTRGWTLQELIAPNLKVFFDSKWRRMGYSWKIQRREPTSTTDMERRFDLQNLPDITKQLSTITAIPADILEGGSLTDLSIAQRMSWAGKRQTTRVEDEAYCLMGIFDVHMPLLYGEGRRSFTRLQEEILKISDDQSIFAHVSPDASSHFGLLAASPAFFRKSMDIGKPQQVQQTATKMLEVKKGGLKARLTVIPIPNESLYLGLLDCSVGRSTVDRPAIYLERLGASEECYHRVLGGIISVVSPQTSHPGYRIQWRGHTLLDKATRSSLSHLDSSNIRKKTIYVLPRLSQFQLTRLPSIHLGNLPEYIELLSVGPRSQWNSEDKSFLPFWDPLFSYQSHATFRFKDRGRRVTFNIVVGYLRETHDESSAPTMTPWFSIEQGKRCVCRDTPEIPVSRQDSGISLSPRYQSQDIPCSAAMSTETWQSTADVSPVLPYLVNSSLSVISFFGSQQLSLDVTALPR